MPINRRQFIATSSLSAGGFGLTALGASADGMALTPSDILADRALSAVYRAVCAYGDTVHLRRDGNAIRIQATIRDLEAFGETYSHHGVADGPVQVLTGTTLSFNHGSTRYLVEHTW